MYNSKTILDIKEDYIKTLEKCYNYTLEDCMKVSGLKVIFRSILKVFAPLM